MVRFYLGEGSQDIKPELAYTLRLWARNQQVDFHFSELPDGSVCIGGSETDPIKISPAWAFAGNPLNDTGFIAGQTGEPDFLATAFYMVNSLQEYNDPDRDELNRFRYRNSYQSRFKNSGRNLVQYCFDEITRRAGLQPRHGKTRFFLTHDIDLVNGAILEDGFNVLKKGRIDLFLRMLFNVAMGRPEWLNMDKIMKIESEYDCKSVFFWMVNRGKINKRERNADYRFSSAAIQEQFRGVEKNGFENGIHKSISNEEFSEEFGKYGRQPFSNRYHYLKFSLPQAYYDIERAGLRLDASLGFAEEIGFRNSYGLPYNPYDLKSRKPFEFIEVPLHVMDRTFFQYKKAPIKEAENEIIDFFEQNREDCVLSILWHNNFFTDYKFKGYLDLYKRILSYIRDNDFKTITQAEIVNKYSII